MIETKTRRGPYAKTVALRETIARAVLDLVDELGHEGVSTSLVAARVGSQEATVLYHFPTRDHLLIAALQLSDDESERVATANREARSLDIEDLRATILSGDDKRTRLQVMLRGQSATPDHPAVEYFQRRTDRSVEIFAGFVERWQAEGTALPSINAREVGTQITALWEGLSAIWILDPSVDVAAALIHAIQRLAGRNIMEVRDLMMRPDLGL